MNYLIYGPAGSDKDTPFARIVESYENVDFLTDSQLSSLLDDKYTMILKPDLILVRDVDPTDFWESFISLLERGVELDGKKSRCFPDYVFIITGAPDQKIVESIEFKSRFYTPLNVSI